ncbi:MAG: DUF4139 domain-containing protein [Tannerella sp.]|jgi:uncharacterized protein (TIGR02231 family)|nr:DUF4139 domain-containing protein [Tannerella sp.]
METKRLFMAGIFLMFLIMNTNAYEKKTISSGLNEATIFYNGAELKHSASATLTKGSHELIIKDLSPNVDPNSIKIKTNNGVMVSAYEYYEDHISKKNIEQIRKEVEDSVNYYQEKIKLIEIEIKVNKEMHALFGKSITQKILSSEKDSCKNKMSLDELIKAIDYYKNKSIEVETLLMKNENEKTHMEAAIAKLNNRVETVEEETQTVGMLKMNVTAKDAGTAQFVISYCTYDAGWKPYYNINVISTDRPIQIISKANVFQTTGLDWKDVKLTLSTGTPNNGKTAPLFRTWFLQERQTISLQNSAAMQNSYGYDKKSAMKDLAFEETGQNTLSDYLTIEDNQLMMTYAIDVPYTIPGDDKEQNIDLRTQETKADYQFYCAPKLDSESYLLAEIIDAEKLDLPRGKAQITYDGMYIGETVIDGTSTMENLTLTLGTDQRVSVKREKMHDFSSKKTFGSDIKQVFTYKITVKNNQKKSIKMVVKDQYPKSTQKGVEVELLKETTKPTHNITETGVVTWEETFAPGETKTYQISYSVKYPKDMNLNL